MSAYMKELISDFAKSLFSTPNFHEVNCKGLKKLWKGTDKIAYDFLPEVEDQLNSLKTSKSADELFTSLEKIFMLSTLESSEPTHKETYEEYKETAEDFDDLFDQRQLRMILSDDKSKESANSELETYIADVFAEFDHIEHVTNRINNLPIIKVIEIINKQYVNPEEANLTLFIPTACQLFINCNRPKVCKYLVNHVKLDLDDVQELRVYVAYHDGLDGGDIPSWKADCIKDWLTMYDPKFTQDQNYPVNDEDEDK